MNVAILASKSILAAVLLIAAGAKSASMSNFAATLRLFVPRRAGSRLTFITATLIVAAEFALGTTSLAFPAIAWVNYAVLAFCIAFLTVSSIGYLFFRGRTCQCFGTLSQRKFDLGGIARSAVLLIMATITIGAVRSASLRLEAVSVILLLALAMLLSAAAFTAARALSAVPEA